MMRRRMDGIVLLALFSMAVVFAAPALACPGNACACDDDGTTAHAGKHGQHGESGKHGHGEASHHGGVHAANGLGREITLSDQQRSDIDALELALAIQEKFGVTTSPDDERNRELFYSVKTLAEFIRVETDAG